MSTNKATLIAVAAPLVGVVGVVGAFVVPGAASAQSGSRICGAEWTANAENDVEPNVPAERLIKFYEVRKGVISECDSALKRGGSDRSPMEAPDELLNMTLHRRSNSVWNYSWSYNMMECESFSQDVLGSDFELVGGDFPSPDPHLYDICRDMNRSDTSFDMEAYWLLWTPVRRADGTMEPQWFLKRG